MLKFGVEYVNIYSYVGCQNYDLVYRDLDVGFQFCFVLLHSIATVITWSVRRPSSVRPQTSFSRKLQSGLTPKFSDRRPLKVFCVFVFQFYDFFSFSLTQDHMEQKSSNDISSESAHRIHSKKQHAYSWAGSLRKLFKELQNFKFWIFDKYFSFSLKWVPMGVKRFKRHLL